jgi:hypothetical protein
MDNCNSIELKPMVTSCFVGGEYSSPYGLLYGQQVDQKLCESPKNQYCISQKGTTSNITINVVV